MRPSAPAAIRPATKADLPTIGRLGALLVREHHDFYPKRFIAATPQTERQYGAYLGTQLDEPNVVILVAVIPSAARNLQFPMDDVVGYAYAGVEGYDYMALRGPAGALHDI